MYYSFRGIKANFGAKKLGPMIELRDHFGQKVSSRALIVHFQTLLGIVGASNRHERERCNHGLFGLIVLLGVDFRERVLDRGPKGVSELYSIFVPENALEIDWEGKEFSCIESYIKRESISLSLSLISRSTITQLSPSVDSPERDSDHLRLNTRPASPLT